MAGAGLLAGLGAGLQQLGGDIFKAKVLDKLKEEEAVRAEKRAEMRKAREVVKTEMITGPDGVPVVQDYNSQGDPVGTFRMPTKQQLTAIQNEEIKNKQETQKRALDISTGEQSLVQSLFKTENMEADRAFDMEQARARTEIQRQSGITGRISALTRGRDKDDDDEEPTEEDFVTETKKVGQPFLEEKDEGGEAVFSAEEQDTLARQAVRRSIVDKVPVSIALKQLTAEAKAGKAGPVKGAARPKVRIIE